MTKSDLKKTHQFKLSFKDDDHETQITKFQAAKCCQFTDLLLWVFPTSLN
jgi:hypothetical protein